MAKSFYQVYHTRIQLAILDHNLHAKRGMARNKKGEQINSQRYRKQTKKWDASPCKEPKKYEYLPQLMQDIMTSRKESVVVVKHKESLPHNHPQKIQQNRYEQKI